MLGYYTVDNFIRWFERKTTIKNLIFYSLNGDLSDGTFVAIVNIKFDFDLAAQLNFMFYLLFCQDRYQLFLNSLSDSNDKLARILDMLDWSRGFKVSTFRKKHRSAVVDTLNAKNLNREFDSETLVYYMPKENAVRITVT